MSSSITPNFLRLFPILLVLQSEEIKKHQLQVNGARFNYTHPRLMRKLDTLIAEIDAWFHRNSMAKHVWNLRYTVRNQCIHCNLTSHESGNHHLSLGIFYVPGDPPHIHCLAPKENDIATMGTPDLGNSVSDKKEQSMTQNKHPTTEYLCNGNQVAQLPPPLPAAYDIYAFNGHTCLIKVHNLLMDFLHHQSHIHLVLKSPLVALVLHY